MATPNVFGGIAGEQHVSYSNGCSGSMFAVSGYDGETKSFSPLIGVFADRHSFDLRFCAPVDSLSHVNGHGGFDAGLMLRVRPPAHYPVNASTILAATHDVLTARWPRAPGQGEGKKGAATASAALTFLSWDVLVGALPAESVVEFAGIATPVVPTASLASNVPMVALPSAGPNCTRLHPFVLCTSVERGRSPGEGAAVLFALLVDRSSARLPQAAGSYPSQQVQHAVAILQNGSRHIWQTAARRLRWIEQTPRLRSCRQRRWLNKAISLIRLNTLAPEGTVRTTWAVSNRAPHGSKTFLWDTCFHSAARTLLDPQGGFDLLMAMLSTIHAPRGAPPVGVAPMSCKSLPSSSRGQACQYGGTQPPLYAWATWFNVRHTLLANRSQTPSHTPLALNRMRGTGDGADSGSEPAAKTAAEAAAEAAEGEAVAVACDRMRRTLPKLEAYLRWNLRHRRGGGGDAVSAEAASWAHAPDGLLLRWQSTGESGMDNLPRSPGLTQGSPDLMALMAREAQHVARMHAAFGRADAEAEWLTTGRNLSKAVHTMMWDERASSYRDRINSTHLAGREAVLSDLYPLLLPDLPPERLAPMIALIRDPRGFHTPVPLPTVARSHPAFSTDMWRGPMWAPTNLIVVLGLLTQRQYAEAHRLMRQTVDAVGGWYEVLGSFFEFYDAANETAPNLVLRKTLPDLAYLLNGPRGPSRRGGSIRDYHWTAAITLAFLLELERGDVLSPSADEEAYLSERLRCKER